MGANTISWRRIKGLNARHGTEFVHAVTWSHHDHWVWLCATHDGATFVYDKRADTVEPVEGDGTKTTTIRMLQTRASWSGQPLNEGEAEWLAELDERARSIGVLA